ncbi:MAG: oligosaccharide flippase family protein [Methylococcaceae bacterium]|nr:oligosaccharide flippase family protein [Methylococcaceae bacterium]
MTGFKKRVVSATFWSVSGQVLQQSLRLISNLFLTRLLVPEMFGVMAVTTVIIIGLTQLSDVGITQKIIQSKHGDNISFLNMAWTLQILQGFFISLIILFVSGCLYYSQKMGFLNISSTYADPRLPGILSLSALVPVITGFKSIHLVSLSRNLKLKPLIGLQVFSQIIGLCAMIFLAWYYQNIWSLVFGGIVSSSALTVLSHRSSFGPRCKFYWDSKIAKDFFSFGKWIIIGSTLGFFVNQGDRIILGALITPEKLGIYVVAYFLANALKELLHRLMASVFYPAISETVRNNPKNISTVYYKLRNRVDFLVAIAAALLCINGHNIIEFLYDGRYIDAGWIIEILSISLLFTGYAMALQCFMALGNTKIHALLSLIRTISTFVFIPLAYSFFGFKAAIWTIAIMPMTEFPVYFYNMYKFKILKIFDELRLYLIFIISYGFFYLINMLFFQELNTTSWNKIYSFFISNYNYITSLI